MTFQPPANHVTSCRAVLLDPHISIVHSTVLCVCISMCVFVRVRCSFYYIWERTAKILPFEKRHSIIRFLIKSPALSCFTKKSGEATVNVLLMNCLGNFARCTLIKFECVTGAEICTGSLHWLHPASCSPQTGRGDGLLHYWCHGICYCITSGLSH